MRIGIFDSGIGGITLLSKAIKLLPDEEYVYYADIDNVPYGTKTKEEILQYSINAVNFLLSKEVDIVVIGCNTATSVAAQTIRGQVDIPVIGIEPAVKPAVMNTRDKRILVLATPMTVKEKKLHDLVDRLDDDHRVDMKALGRLPAFAEQGRFDDSEVASYIRGELADIETKDYAAVVLGCTHFNHFLDVFKTIFSEDTLYLDGSDGTVRHLFNKVNDMRLSSSGQLKITYYESGRLVESDERMAFYRMIMKRI